MPSKLLASIIAAGSFLRAPVNQRGCIENQLYRQASPFLIDVFTGTVFTQGDILLPQLSTILFSELGLEAAMEFIAEFIDASEVVRGLTAAI